MTNCLTAHIPKLRSRRSTFLGIEISEKSWVYLLATQLFFSQGLQSITSGSLGLLIGLIYSKNCFGLQQWRLPRATDVSSLGYPFKMV